MSKNKKKVSFLRRYLNAIVVSFFSAFVVGFLIPLWIAVGKLNSIKVGEYPGMPQDEINKQYQEVLPSVIQDSILMCVVITILASIPTLLIRFKISHNINLFSELVRYLRNRNQ